MLRILSLAGNTRFVLTGFAEIFSDFQFNQGVYVPDHEFGMYLFNDLYLMHRKPANEL